MDQRLHDLWRKGEYPFDQPMIYCRADATVGSVQACMRETVKYLKPRFALKYINRDWHMHHGTIRESREISWEVYETMLLDEDTFRRAQDGDDCVCLAAYPENLGFLLRCYVSWPFPSKSGMTWDEYVLTATQGWFGLTIDAKHEEEVLRLLEPVGIALRRVVSKVWFDEFYGGNTQESGDGAE